MNVESTQPGRKLEWKRVFLIFGAVVAAMMLASPAPAATNAVSDAMWASVDQLVQAAVAAGGDDSASALTALNDAEDLLNQAKEALPTSGFSTKLVSKLGKGIDATNKKLAGLDSQLESLSEKSAVSKLSSAAKSLQKYANLAGRPLLEEVTPNNSAGFLKAGALVTMAYAIPASCGTDWTVTCTPPASASGVIASYTPDYTTGKIVITMGPAQGGADVSIKGCGCAVECCSRELYNYGGKTSTSTSGLPDGFPTNLTKGNYEMTYSYSIGSIQCCSGDPQVCDTTPGSSVGTTSLGTFPMTNLKTFSKILVQAFNTAVAAATTSGCSQNVSYSPFAEDTFTVTYTVTCTQPGCTGGATTVTFTLQKQ
jgi:hypothetical protein